VNPCEDLSDLGASTLLHLAGLVADREPIDWDEALPGEPDAADVVLALKILAEISRASPLEDEATADEGRRWRHLEILGPLGEGAYGTVVLARDTLLERLVALKLFPVDPQSARQRLEVLREGRLLARLRHPGVVAVFGVDEADGLIGLWMEFVRGRTLAELLAISGRFSAREAISVGLELCQALAAVHAAGVLHRDIKAENVLREDGGRLVLVDFGLGLPTERAGASEPSGTPFYVAPEILDGEPASRGSDIYALGVLLFRLVVDRFPVEATSLAGLRAAHRDGARASLRDLRPDLPAGFVALVDRALANTPHERFESVGALERELERLSGAADRNLPPSASRRRGWLWGAVGAAVVGLAGGLWWVARTPDPAAVDPFASPFASRQLSNTPELEAEPALSPDGSLVAYVSHQAGNEDVWVLDVGSGKTLRLSTNEGEDRAPSWSADGAWVYFESRRGGEAQVWRVGRLGGLETFVTKGADPAASPDGKWLAVARRITPPALDIVLVPVAGDGPEVVLTGVGDGLLYRRDPAWSPSGSAIAYRDSGDLWLADPTQREPPRRLTHDTAGYGPPAWLDDTTLYAAANREVTRAIWRIGLDGTVRRATAGAGPEDQPSFSRDGRTVVYNTLRDDLDLAVVDLSSGALTHLATTAQEFGPAIAPDGGWVVYTTNQRGRWELWRTNLRGGVPEGDPAVLVSGELAPSNPVIAPSGASILYQRKVGDQRDIFLVDATGGPEVAVAATAAHEYHPAWFGDETVLFLRDLGGVWELVAYDPSGQRPEAVWLRSDAVAALRGSQARAPTVSPTGDVALVVWQEGGGSEVWGFVPGAAPRQITRGADANRVRWLDSERLAVAGRWGGERTQLRVVDRNGAPGLVTWAPLDLGVSEDGGSFDLDPLGRWLVFDRADPTGDLWLLRPRDS
jgi:serine/threonine-protein kinase